ncbi:MAG: protein-L-isoaspartate(D-aspartate) O-methyltransferase [Deferribacterota bacterium]|nr:protein-L-isoaspartate(D-aspartate) O-methyltransferase [Deferribacterota bacterium]
MNDNFKDLREKMVKVQLISRGINDKKVLKAFLEIPREEFVPDNLKKYAYEDGPLSIGFGQTISQPYMVAAMTELLNLNSDEILLEIGAGSGYQAAIASKLCKYVYTIERIKELAEYARNNLERLGIDNVKVIVGDGSKGYPENAPYDKILYTAATPYIGDIIFDQLKDNGAIVAPIGDRFAQKLTKYVKTKNKIKEYSYFSCIFVPLIGEYGYK